MRLFLVAVATTLLTCGAPGTGWAQAAAASSTAAAPEQVNAQVLQIDAGRSLVTLKHARIKSINMEAMTMRFKVRDTALLAPLKAGDKVRFSVALENDELMVTDIRRKP